jgi:hypothetical protein
VPGVKLFSKINSRIISLWKKDQKINIEKGRDQIVKDYQICNVEIFFLKENSYLIWTVGSNLHGWILNKQRDIFILISHVETDRTVSRPKILNFGSD